MLQELIFQIPTLTSFINGAQSLPFAEKRVYLDVIGHLEPALQIGKGMDTNYL
jgi:hypothetical protein